MPKRIAIVGFGYIGACIGAVLADRRFSVVGIDTQHATVEAINRGEASISEPGLSELVRNGVQAGRLRATTDHSAVAAADVIIMTVGTPLGANFEPDTRQVIAATRKIGEHLRAGQLVVLKSTVPPHTTEEVVRPILESSGLVAGKDFWLAFCPERLAEGRAIREFQTLPIVVGGVDAESTRLASEFWSEALGVPIVSVANARTAEMTKLADNLFIDLNIALANELAMLSDKLGVDVLEVIESANTLPKGGHHVNILLPSMGVGGSCLTKDPWFVYHLGRLHGVEMQLPKASRTVNDAMPTYTYGLIEEELAAAGKSLPDSTVAVLGMAFKNNTGDVRFTPTKETIELLEHSGCALRIFDPWVDPDEARNVTQLPLTPTIEDAIRDVDCVAFLSGHDEFQRLETSDIIAQTASGCVIIDGRLYLSRSDIEELRRGGLRYRGIGR